MSHQQTATTSATGTETTRILQGIFSAPLLPQLRISWCISRGKVHLKAYRGSVNGCAMVLFVHIEGAAPFVVQYADSIARENHVRLPGGKLIISFSGLTNDVAVSSLVNPVIAAGSPVTHANGIMNVVSKAIEDRRVHELTRDGDLIVEQYNSLVQDQSSGQYWVAFSVGVRASRNMEADVSNIDLTMEKHNLNFLDEMQAASSSESGAGSEAEYVADSRSIRRSDSFIEVPDSWS